MLRQHRALFHVGHVTAFALVKANQHSALFMHVAHRQPGAVAVAPGRAFNRTQDVVGLDLAQMVQVVFQHALFHSHLRTHMQMLHLAATTRPGVQAKVRTTGCHALG